MLTLESELNWTIVRHVRLTIVLFFINVFEEGRDVSLPANIAQTNLATFGHDELAFISDVKLILLHTVREHELFEGYHLLECLSDNVKVLLIAKTLPSTTYLVMRLSHAVSFGRFASMITEMKRVPE